MTMCVSDTMKLFSNESEIDANRFTMCCISFRLRQFRKEFSRCRSKSAENEGNFNYLQVQSHFT